MTLLDELIAKAKAEVSEPSETTVPVFVGGELLDLVFQVFDPRDWLNLTAVHPRRAGSLTDSRLGYNTDVVAEEATPLCGFQRVDGVLVPISDEQCGALFGYERDEKNAKVRVLGLLSAEDRETIATVLWGLNVLEPIQRVNAAKKASAAKPQRKPRSRGNSGSRSAG